MNYWLFKSEPTTFSIDDLQKIPNQTTHWEGIRNFQVRNMLRDQVKIGDKAFFYHSNCAQPGIMGVIEIVKAGYPDFTAFDSESNYYDPKSKPEKPQWFMVDVRFVKKGLHSVPLEQIKNHPQLTNMWVARRGNRLSITPVTAEEWQILNKMTS